MNFDTIAEADDALALGYETRNVLYYTFVNHSATMGDIVADVGEATALSHEDIAFALSELIRRGIAWAEPCGQVARYHNTLYVGDIKGIENVPSVAYYLARTDKGVATRSEREVRERIGR